MGVEEQQTEASEGSMGVLTNPNFQALLLGKPGCAREWMSGSSVESCCLCSSPALQHREADAPLLGHGMESRVTASTPWRASSQNPSRGLGSSCTTCSIMWLYSFKPIGF